MMKAMLSQPMAGKTDEEIIARSVLRFNQKWRKRRDNDTN